MLRRRPRLVSVKRFRKIRFEPEQLIFTGYVAYEIGRTLLPASDQQALSAAWSEHKMNCLNSIFAKYKGHSVMESSHPAPASSARASLLRLEQ